MNILDMHDKYRAEDRRNLVLPAEPALTDPTGVLVVVVEQGMGITGPPVKYPATERQRASYEAYLRTMRADYDAYLRQRGLR